MFMLVCVCGVCECEGEGERESDMHCIQSISCLVILKRLAFITTKKNNERKGRIANPQKKLERCSRQNIV